MKLHLRLFLTVLSAGLLAASFIEHIAFLAWFALIPYFIVVSKSSKRSSILLSWLCGLLFFAGATCWFTQYSYALWFPIIVILSFFFIFYGIAFKLAYVKIKNTGIRMLVISSVWIAVEFFRHRTFLAFPWGL